MLRTRILATVGALVVAAPMVVVPLTGAASAHTESDVVAVAAGSPAAVSLQPTHGCGDAATVDVAILAPIADAIAGEVPGWTATSEPDDGGTVLRWTGGVLASDEAGAFPVEFTAPDDVGALLTFPSIQTCEDGAELAWISGDPEAEFPAPRVLVLAAGSAAAATIDDVPADAPGRDQLVEIIDVDNPSEAPAATTTTTGTDPATATSPTTSVAVPADGGATADEPGSESAAPAAPSQDVSDDDGGGAGPVVAIAAAVVVVALAGAMVYRRRTG